MSNIRAFLALNLPARVIEEVRGLQDRLRAAADEAGMKVAWVPPPNMHVTLKFLAEIPQESVTAIQDLLRPRLEARPAPSLSVTGIGAFPDRSKPSVLWIGVGSAEAQLEALAAEIDACLDEGLGFAPERRPFHAHLTLGRVKLAGEIDLLEGLEQRDFGRCVAHEVVLYKSVLQRRGAEYTPLARFALGGASGRPVSAGAAADGGAALEGA